MRLFLFFTLMMLNFVIFSAFATEVTCDPIVLRGSTFGIGGIPDTFSIYSFSPFGDGSSLNGTYKFEYHVYESRDISPWPNRTMNLDVKVLKQVLIESNEITGENVYSVKVEITWPWGGHSEKFTHCIEK